MVRRAAVPRLIIAIMAVLARMVGTILAATFLVFVGLEISIRGGFRTVVMPPGVDGSSPVGRRIIETYRLDSNVVERYAWWVWDILHGEWRESLRTGQPVTEIILHRLPISIEIMLVAFVLTIAVGIPLGLFAAYRTLRGKGQVTSALISASQSLPVFVTTIFLIRVFAIRLGWLPAAGWTRISDSLVGNIKGLALPVLGLVIAEFGMVARVIQSDVQVVLESDFIAAARGKGLSERYVMFRHALRPASLGLFNTLADNIGSLLSGAVVVELIFGIGALGQVMFEATINRDLYLILALTVYTVSIYVVLSALADTFMMAADPRIRRK